MNQVCACGLCTAVSFCKFHGRAMHAPTDWCVVLHIVGVADLSDPRANTVRPYELGNDRRRVPQSFIWLYGAPSRRPLRGTFHRWVCAKTNHARALREAPLRGCVLPLGLYGFCGQTSSPLRIRGYIYFLFCFRCPAETVIHIAAAVEVYGLRAERL